MFKQSYLANLHKKTFILFECHRSIDKSIDFSFCYCEIVHNNREFSRWNSKPSHESKITTHLVDLWAIFIWVCFQQISLRPFFKIKEKPYFGVIFAQRKFFLKTLAKYNYKGPPPFRCQRYKLDWAGNQTKNYSITISMQKHSINMLNSSNHLWDTLELRVPWSMRSHSFFTMSTQWPNDLNLYQHEKNQLISSIHSWDIADFRVSRSRRPCPFLTNTMQKLLK